MKTGVHSVSRGLVVFLALLTIVRGSEWDDQMPAHGVEPVDRLAERRTPGWRTRQKFDTVAEELAHADQLRGSGRIRAAIRRYRAVVANWPDAPQAVEAQQRVAELHEDRGKPAKAFQEYQYLIRHYAGRFDYQAVIKRQYAIAMRLATEPTGLFKTLTSPQEVIQKLETLRANAPSWERAPEIQMMIGTLHERSGDYELAMTAYEALQRRYPQSPQADRAAFREIHCMVMLARKYPTDEAWIRETRAMVRRYVARASDSENRDRAERYLRDMEARLIAFWQDRAHFYDHIQQRPRAALIVYQEWLRRFPVAPQSDAVRERINQLQAKVGDS